MPLDALDLVNRRCADGDDAEHIYHWGGQVRDDLAVRLLAPAPGCLHESGEGAPFAYAENPPEMVGPGDEETNRESGAVYTLGEY